MKSKVKKCVWKKSELSYTYMYIDFDNMVVVGSVDKCTKYIAEMHLFKWQSKFDTLEEAKAFIESKYEAYVLSLIEEVDNG